jgi:hypothetical protein
VALTTAYAAGLRVSEVAALKVRDIDSSRMVMRRARQGRQGALWGAFGPVARHFAHLLAADASAVVSFPGRTPDKPIEPTVLHAACRSATAAARIDKRSACTCSGTASPPTSGERRRHPDHLGGSRPRECVDDSALHARLRRGHRPDRELSRSAVSAGDGAGIGGEDSAGLRTGRRLSPANTVLAFLLGPVFSRRENGSESDAEHFAFQIREGFPIQQMSDS